MHGTTLRTSNQ